MALGRLHDSDLLPQIFPTSCLRTNAGTVLISEKKTNIIKKRRHFSFFFSTKPDGVAVRLCQTGVLAVVVDAAVVGLARGSPNWRGSTRARARRRRNLPKGTRATSTKGCRRCRASAERVRGATDRSRGMQTPDPVRRGFATNRPRRGPRSGRRPSRRRGTPWPRPSIRSGAAPATHSTTGRSVGPPSRPRPRCLCRFSFPFVLCFYFLQFCFFLFSWSVAARSRLTRTFSVSLLSSCWDLGALLVASLRSVLAPPFCLFHGAAVPVVHPVIGRGPRPSLEKKERQKNILPKKRDQAGCPVAALAHAKPRRWLFPVFLFSCTKPRRRPKKGWREKKDIGPGQKRRGCSGRYCGPPETIARSLFFPFALFYVAYSKEKEHTKGQCQRTSQRNKRQTEKKRKAMGATMEKTAAAISSVRSGTPDERRKRRGRE